MAAKSIAQIEVKHLLPNGERVRPGGDCICKRNVTIRYEYPLLDCDNVTNITDEYEISIECNDNFMLCGWDITRTCPSCQELGYTVDNNNGHKYS